METGYSASMDTFFDKNRNMGFKFICWPLFFSAFYLSAAFPEESLVHRIQSSKNTTRKEQSDDAKEREMNICMYKNGAVANGLFSTNFGRKGEDLNLGKTGLFEVSQYPIPRLGSKKAGSRESGNNNVADAGEPLPSEVIVRNLSTAVQKESIMIHAPIATEVAEYWLESDDSKENDTSERSSKKGGKESRDIKEDKRTEEAEKDSQQEQKQKLIVKFFRFYPQDDDLWRLQYSVKNIQWVANHVLEFLDLEHVNFSTVIRVINSSGINFYNTNIQFFDKQLPGSQEQQEETTSQNGTTLAYRDKMARDLKSGKETNIVWKHAKRVAISTNNGLFVGGKYLEKMDGTSYPQVENWITFPNTKAVGLGKPLPSGKVTIFYNANGFTSVLGYAELEQTKSDGEVVIRIPDFNAHAGDSEYTFITAQLVQENYRKLTPSMSEAEYKLSIQNLKDKSVPLRITVNKNINQKCMIVRSNIKTEISSKNEIIWRLEIPAKSVAELRYKLMIVNNT
ncbi:MAG: hypothetical protein LBF84_00585 [Holosporales bacterium]|jgi:hypothetical protein|nr:hypothetical protein [Holosporales bacterium]